MKHVARGLDGLAWVLFRMCAPVGAATSHLLTDGGTDRKATALNNAGEAPPPGPRPSGPVDVGVPNTVAAEEFMCKAGTRTRP